MSDFLFRQDTIAAVSTPPGRGAIGVIRLSGPESTARAAEFWTGRPILDMATRQACLGTLVSPAGDPVDECLLIRFEGPHSFTGEDMVEIHAHGNPAILSEILRLLVSRGVRPAEPGEFSYRAFRNGRISLVQAESIAQLIDAHSAWARRNALAVLAEDGDRWVRDLVDRLLEIWTPIEADLEFPTDDLDSLDLRTFLPDLEQMKRQVADLIQRSVRYSKLQEGYRVVLAGSPNAGKSSLLNALLGYRRALVTEIPGTTRDTLEESFDVRGIPVRLIDTAGLGEAQNELDALGMERSREALDRADLVLWIVDAAAAPPETQCPPSESPTLVVANKIDLLPEGSGWRRRGDAVCVSATECVGLEELLDRVGAVLTSAGGIDPEERLMLNQRQAETLERVSDSIHRAIHNIESNGHQELVATDLADARKALEDLSGQTIQIDLMESIFSRFCIGK